MEEKIKFTHSLVVPTLFVLLLWLIKCLEFLFEFDLFFLGLYPRKILGLASIITAPLIHGSFTHLLSNTFPLIILGGGMLYFYRKVAYEVFFWIYILVGLWVWMAARPVYHIGASGLIYGFASFLFFSGVFRRDRRSMAISLLIIFIYGGMIWGILPLREGISWESHLAGGIAGILCAFYFRKVVMPKEYDWEEEDENTDYTDEDTDYTDESESMKFKYIYTPDKKVKSKK